MTAQPHRPFLAAISILALALGLLAGPGPAVAAAVDLRPDLAAPGGRVTLGDLFEGASGASGVLVASGGEAGGSLVLDARQVQAVAAANGLQWANARGLGRLIARVQSNPAPLGRRAATAEVLTYARDFAAGEVVQPEDIVWAAPSGFGAPIDTPRDARSVIGQAARRPLRAGTSVSLADLSAPKVIKRDEMVQVAYAAGGVRLLLQGKAMGGAAIGEVVDIQNPASKKIIQAVASGPDEAVVGPEAERIKAAAATRPKLFASLN